MEKIMEWLAKPQGSLWAGLVSLALVGGGLGLQFFLGFEPCPLCIFQRVGFIAFGAASVAAWALGDGKAGTAMRAVALACALAGLGVAVKHLMLLAAPPASASCGADLDYLMEAFAPSRWLPMVFSGAADCQEAAKRPFLGVPLPAWAFAWFWAFSMAQGTALLRKFRS